VFSKKTLAPVPFSLSNRSTCLGAVSLELCMTSASSLAFPGSRTLATWWRQLAPQQPRGLGVGYLFVHRLEAPALWRRPEPLEPLLLLFLEALASLQDEPPDSAWVLLSKRLQLGDAILQRLLQALAKLHLVEVQVSTEPSWRLTAAAEETLRTKCIWSQREERSPFSFLERLGPTGRRLALPHYLDIKDAPFSPWSVEDGTLFDVAWLFACTDQTLEWKQSFGFPTDLLSFALPGAQDTGWQNIVLDKPERLLVAFFLTSKPTEEFVACGVRPEGWQLNATEPIVRLPAAASEILTQAPAIDAFRDAWQTWCRPRILPQAEVQQCQLTLTDACLRVAVPELLWQYLVTTKNDVLKGETWLLAGDGYVRQAARLEICSS
jgi:hypothetical protein